MGRLRHAEAPSPISSHGLTPKTMRANRSRPFWSVPNRWSSARCEQRDSGVRRIGIHVREQAWEQRGHYHDDKTRRSPRLRAARHRAPWWRPLADLADRAGSAGALLLTKPRIDEPVQHITRQSPRPADRLPADGPEFRAGETTHPRRVFAAGQARHPTGSTSRLTVSRRTGFPRIWFGGRSRNP